MNDRRRRVVVLGVMLSIFLAAMESTVVATAMPRVVASLGGLEVYSWVFSGFLLIGFQEYFRGLGPWRLVIFGALLVFVMLFARRGLAGLKKYLW